MASKNIKENIKNGLDLEYQEGDKLDRNIMNLELYSHETIEISKSQEIEEMNYLDHKYRFPVCVIDTMHTIIKRVEYKTVNKFLDH